MLHFKYLSELIKFKVKLFFFHLPKVNKSTYKHVYIFMQICSLLGVFATSRFLDNVPSMTFVISEAFIKISFLFIFTLERHDS